jgi:hypothetical protein
MLIKYMKMFFVGELWVNIRAVGELWVTVRAKQGSVTS